MTYKEMREFVMSAVHIWKVYVGDIYGRGHYYYHDEKDLDCRMYDIVYQALEFAEDGAYISMKDGNVEISDGNLKYVIYCEKGGQDGQGNN